jgi:zinc-dependent metalloproteinase lipoprotein
MAKIYSVLAGGLLSLLALGLQPAAAQTQPLPPHRTCGTEEINAQIQAELERTIPGYNPARSTNHGSPSALRTTAVTYTLPVIVHVINNGEAVGVGSNIAQGQVQSQLDVLNEDYRNTNADGTLVPAVYQPRRGDMQVQFVAALRDPNGNVLAEPGIDRVNRNTKGWTAPPYVQGYINSTIKPATSWDPDRYINIWVMNLGNSLLGYAQFPDNTANVGGLNTLGGSAATDGVVVLYTAYGSRAKFPAGSFGAATNPYDRGRTLTHELGHWFGFRHIWGDTACGDDYCADTPTQQEENYGCVAFPQVTCSNVTGDMSMNYMDYTNDACMYMFTQAQKDRLQAIMLNTPRRAALASSNVACPVVVPATATNGGAGCLGGSATLTATGPAGATYAWTGPNGFTSTAQNPTLTNLTVASAGTYKVTVTVATGTACPGVATTTLAVNPSPATPSIATVPTVVCPGSSVTLAGSGTVVSGTLPNTNFDSGAPAGWAIVNNGAPATTWQYTAGNTLSYSSSSWQGFNGLSLNGSRFAYSISDAGGSNSITDTKLTSPAFSTVGYSALNVSFQQVTILESGYGAVEISTDGGTTWTAVYTNTDNLTSVTTTTVNLNGYLNQPNVRLRWHYTDDWGYIWAIDNIAFTGTPATYSYAWSLVSGNGLPTATNTASIAATPTQNSVYRLTIGFAGGSCTSSSTVSVNVYPTPTLVTSAALACPGSPAILSATNAANIAAFSPTYAWSLVSGDGLPATTNAATLSVTPTQNSVYRLTVTYPGSCPLSSTVSVGVVPTPTLAASASVVCAGTTSQLSATNIPTTGYTYAWTLVSGDGLPATVNTPTITVSPTQLSVYRLTVSNSGCSTSATVAVTGVTNQIDAYPVPFGDAGLSLKVSTCTAGPATVQIYDTMGRRVYESTVGTPQAGITPIDMPETGRLRPGKYIVKVQQGTQNTTFNVVRQ